jgi:hypothetical protein
VHAVLGQRGDDLVGRLVIDEHVVEHRLAVAVLEHRPPEDLGGVQGRGGGEADLDRVEVIEHAAVLGDVVALVAEVDLGVAHLAVEEVAAVALVDDDAVVLIDRRHVGTRREEDALDHALDGGDVQLGVGVGLDVFSSFRPKMSAKVWKLSRRASL